MTMPVEMCRTRWLRSVALGLSSAVLAGCTMLSGAPTVADPNAREGYVPVDQLQIVDCLLPGQIRKLGDMVYKTQRRPIRTTAADCEIRGGEYVAYDRADYRSALHVWMPRAKEGEAKAQNYVGEIFEKGLGRTPDYVSAAAWYRRAAKQGYSRAMINLGFLYEKGLGVDQDMTQALYWYRKASGLSPEEDQIVWQASVQKVRDKLNKQLAMARQQVSVLQEQIERIKSNRQQLKQKLERARNQGGASADRATALQGRLSQARQQIATLEQLAQRATAEREQLDEKLSGMPEPTKVADTRAMAATGGGAPAGSVVLSEAEQPESLSLRGIEFGKYYALIIGNQNYEYLSDLQTPLGDAKKLQQVLEQKYGFQTYLVPNATKLAILNALNDLYKIVGENDNLLIYYAGHGELSNSGALDRIRGYWLPVGAQRDRLAHWINNTVISDHLDRIKARSILVVADSCYAGAMASMQSALLLASGRAKLSNEVIKSGLSRPSRIVISSGGVAPVYDVGAKGNHSLFTGALLDVLRRNDGILRENMLFARVAVKVRRRAQKLGVQQTPQMRPIRGAGHAGGDFYFVPTAVEKVAAR